MRLIRSASTASFIPTYALANLGAHVGFMPLVILLLPRRVEALAPLGKVALLSWLLLIGAVVASIAHIIAGHASDRWLARHGRRRGVIAIGLAALVGAYFLLAFAQTLPGLVVAVVIFQAALNLMFAPLGALLADHVADAKKGMAAGLLNFALPLSGLVVTLLGLWSVRDGALPFIIVAALIALLVAPLLLAWPRDLPLLSAQHGATDRQGPQSADLMRNFALALVARLLIQLGAAVILSYLYFYVENKVGTASHYTLGSASDGVARLSLVATLASLAAGIAGGHLSDRIGRRRIPLVLAALVCAASLAALATLDDWRAIVFAYAAFVAALTAFLSIHSAMVAQMLGNEPRRGALLGLMNLANTLPSVAAPALTLAYGGLLLSSRLFEALLLTTTGTAAIAAVLIAMVRVR